MPDQLSSGSSDLDAAVLYELRDGAARITLNRPDRRNALSADIVNGLSQALDRANHDDAVRCLVLTGAGEGFCAGADLKNPPGKKRVDDDDSAPNVPFADVLTAMWDAPKPVIVAVNGAAYGGGLGLVAAGDIVITAEEAKFSFSEVRIGVIPAIISVLCLRKLGPHHGMRLFLTGDRFDGPEAVDLGLAHSAVPKSELCDAVDRQVAALRLAAPNAMAECKKLVREIPKLSVEEGFALTGEWSARMFRMQEAQEGMAAFREKRKPSWAVVDD